METDTQEQNQDNQKRITISVVKRNIVLIFQHLLETRQLSEKNLLFDDYVEIMTLSSEEIMRDKKHERVLWELYKELLHIDKKITIDGLLAIDRFETHDDVKVFFNRRKNSGRSSIDEVFASARWRLKLSLWVVMLLQLYTLVGNNLASELNKAQTEYAQLNKETRQIEDAILNSLQTTKTVQSSSTTFDNTINNIQDMDASAITEAVYKRAESLPQYKELSEKKETQAQRTQVLTSSLKTWNTLNIITWIQWVQSADKSKEYKELLVQQTYAKTTLEALTLYFLPLFYGMLGASVFIFRNINQTIIECSFSRFSLYKHRLRYILGGVLGVTVGLFFTPSIGVSGDTYANPVTLAGLAFLAGFGVEAVFDYFDLLVEKLRSGIDIKKFMDYDAKNKFKSKQKNLTTSHSHEPTHTNSRSNE